MDMGTVHVSQNHLHPSGDFSKSSGNRSTQTSMPG